MHAVFLVMPYVWIDADDVGHGKVFIVAADSEKSARHEARSVANDGNMAEWGYASEWDGHEHAGDWFFYVCAPCDCGDTNCADENKPHEQRTACMALREQMARAFPTLDAARQACAIAWGVGSPAVYDYRVESDDGVALDSSALARA